MLGRRALPYGLLLALYGASLPPWEAAGTLVAAGLVGTALAAVALAARRGGQAAGLLLASQFAIGGHLVTRALAAGGGAPPLPDIGMRELGLLVLGAVLAEPAADQPADPSRGAARVGSPAEATRAGGTIEAQERPGATGPRSLRDPLLLARLYFDLGEARLAMRALARAARARRSGLPPPP